MPATSDRLIFVLVYPGSGVASGIGVTFAVAAGVGVYVGVAVGFAVAVGVGSTTELTIIPSEHK